MFYNIEKSANHIRKLRKLSGHTQEKIAQILNIDRSFYSRIESGKNGCSVDLFIQLSDLFGVSLDYLILGKYNDIHPGNAEQHILKEDIKRLILHLEQFDAEL